MRPGRNSVSRLPTRGNCFLRLFWMAFGNLVLLMRAMTSEAP